MHFGAMTPQGWRHDLDGLTPQEGFARMIEVTQRLEQLGFDSAWVYDHFHAVPAPAEPGTMVFECWTSMMALAVQTTKIRLGQMVTCTPYRNAGYLAKVASCIDVASAGRLELGLGAGWYQDEFDAYGYGFPDVKTRLGYLRDTVNIVKAMWSDERATYEGEYASVRGALNDPKPLQSPHPPIWIGGGGEQVTLKLAARHADWTNFGGPMESFLRKRAVVHEHCESVGRDPSEIQHSFQCELIVGGDDAEVNDLLERYPGTWTRSREERVESQLIGTVQQVTDKIGALRDNGCAAVVMWLPDYPRTDLLERFAAEVMPAFRT